MEGFFDLMRKERSMRERLKELEARIEDLKELVSAYRDGILKEKLV